MKKLITLFIGILSISSVYSQAAWEKIFEKKSIAEIATMITKNSDEILFFSRDGKIATLSTDFGNTWSNSIISSEHSFIDYSAKIISKDNTVIFQKEDSLVYSSDFGKNWRTIQGTDTLGEVNSMFLKDSTTLFIGSKTEGVFKYDIPTKVYTNLNNGYLVSEVQWVYVNDDNYIFCQTLDKKILYTRNNGITWINRANPGALIYDQVEIDESNLIVATKNAIFKTTNVGYTWERIDQNFDPNIIYSIQKNNENIFCWSYNGIFVSSNGGVNWEFIKEFDPASSVSISLDDVIFYSTRNSGITYSTDIGASWDWIIPETETRLPITAVSYHPGNGIFAASYNRGLYRITGDQIEYLGFQSPGRKIDQIYIDNDDNLFVQTGVIYFSNDTGLTWKVRSPINLNSINNYAGVVELKFINGGEIILVGTNQSTIFKSYDKGQTWVWLHSIAGILALSSVENEFLLVSNEQIVYGDHEYGLYKTFNYINLYETLNEVVHSILQIDNSTYLVGAGAWSTQQLFRSTDYAESWSPTGFTKVVNRFLYDSDSSIYIASDDGVYLSTDEGISWAKLNMQGLEDKKIYDLTKSEDGRLIAAAIDGVYRTTLQISTHTEKETIVKYEFYLSQNYPNPFNPTTIINFVIPSGVEGLSTLKVYDLLGREVAILINKPMSAGTYEVEFDGSGLPSGVYFYKLTAGKFTDTKKLLLLK